MVKKKKKTPARVWEVILREKRERRAGQKLRHNFLTPVHTQMSFPAPKGISQWQLFIHNNLGYCKNSPVLVWRCKSRKRPLRSKAAPKRRGGWCVRWILQYFLPMQRVAQSSWIWANLPPLALIPPRRHVPLSRREGSPPSLPSTALLVPSDCDVLTV